MQLIVPLSEAGSADRSQVGTKALALGRLLAAGRSVPSGFVITTDAAAMATGGVVPSSVSESLADALGTLSGPLAYRSSAVAEDLGHASYAGQYETVLDVEGFEAGLAAVQRCWASAQAGNVQSYRSEHGDHEERIAVIVQEMVQATAAGVTFTANPVTGADEIVIEAVAGLGEALMAGDVTPARWVATPDVSLESEGPTGPVLTPAEATSVAEECTSIAADAGEALDIEWALAGDSLHILQARPITALPLEPNVEPPAKQTWVRNDAYFNTPITPLSFSAWLPIHSSSFSTVTAHFGLPFDRIDHRHWYGRVYDRVVPLGEMKTDLPLPPAPILRVVVRVAPPFRRRLAVAAASAQEDRPMAAITAWESGGRDALRSRTRELRDVDRAALSDPELSDHLDDVMDQLLRAAVEHFTLTFAGMFILSGQLGMLMEELLGWPPERLLDLVQGYGEASVADGAALEQLSEAIRTDVEARELLSTDPLSLVDHPGPGGTALRSFLEAHGHRLIAADLGEPTWSEDPAPLLRMVGVRLDQARPDNDPRAVSARAEAEALAAITDPTDRERFIDALARARTGRPYGDETEIDVADVLALVRYIAVEAGRRLAIAGRTSSEDAIFLCHVDEVRDMLRGAEVPADLDRREAHHRWALANSTPGQFGPDPVDPPSPDVFPARTRPIAAAAMWSLRLFQPPAVDAGDDRLQGLPASPGKVTGPVRIVRSPAEFDRVRPGDIMVCHHTMASWSPIFGILGGLVTEHGGPLSHPGTLAREYGLPAVLSLSGATDLFDDGEVITIDGATGEVELLR